MKEVMGQMDIAFPNLGIYLANVPKSIHVFGFEIAFYGMILALGTLLGFVMANRECNRMGLPKDLIWDFAVPGIFFSVVGARIYYVFFSWEYYKNHPIDIINIRQGGIAMYGSVIGGVITLYVFSRIKKQSFLKLVDASGIGLLIGQLIGRWGNFMNREVFGGYTDNILAMRLPIDAVRSMDITSDVAAHITEGTNYIQVHPTFLYESLWNLSLLILILLYRKHKKFDGEVFVLYLGGYGIGRFWIEGIRTDRLLIPGTNLAISQLLGMIMFITAVLVILVMRLKYLKKTPAVQKLDSDKKN